MFEPFFQFCSNYVCFSEDEKTEIKKFFTYRKVPKKTILQSENKIAKELFFINKGILRLYFSKDGADITAFFFRENLFASCYDSFLRQALGLQSLETLEDTELLIITYENLQNLYKKIPKMETLARKIAEQRFVNSQMILASHILDNPLERWKKFEKNNQDLILRVPHHMIASFLGITPVSLSRIRKRLLDK